MTARRLRGFNLVEIMIILVVVGLLASAALIPLWSLNKNADYDEELRRMETIRTAIFGYATRHRTRAGAAAVVSLLNESARTFSLPAGRPFLPCPDISGDGYEDRENADITGFSAFSISLTTFALTDPMDAVSESAVRDFRRCESPRGALPWRTLGVPPADRWGNLYTYYVDDVFADAQTGFNENAAIDIYDPRMRVTVNATATPLYGLRDAPPLVLCGNAESCFGTAALTLVAGRQADAAFSLLFRDFAATEVVDGASFAVVSHGENGTGAAKYEVNLPARPVGVSGLICSSPIAGASGSMSPNLDAPAPEAFNFPFVRAAMAGEVMCLTPQVGGADVPDGFLIAGISRTNSGIGVPGSAFDDIVVWASRDELVDVMYSGGALPAPDFPALRTY